MEKDYRDPLDAEISKRRKRKIAVFKDSTFPKSKSASSPDYLAKLLKEAGYAVTFLDAQELIDPNILNRSSFDLLVLPDGTFYPANGKSTLVNYLKSGGAFFSTGGYAFDKLLEPGSKQGTWSIELDLSAVAAQKDPTIAAQRINTRYGKPGDTLGLHPDQIGVFDPSYRLKNVAYLETAANQHVINEKIKLEGEFSGFAATAMIGSNSPVFPDIFARFIPLIDGYDKYDQLVGSAGAMVLNYAGPYAKSAWAFFGINNTDLFSPERPSMSQIFVETVGALIDRTFLHELKTNYACYRQGEEIRLSVKISNFGNKPVKANIAFFVDEHQLGNDSVELQAGETQQVEAVFCLEKSGSDFYRVSASLTIDDVELDELETGFVVWNDEIISSGFPVDFKDNYFHKGERSVFLSGTNQTGMMWYADDENPLVWDRDFAKMRDYGIEILRVLHFSPFSEGGYDGRPTNNPLGLKNLPEKLIRQTDAMVQMAQKHKVILFLTLHDWMRVELSDEELQAQRDWNEFWVKRYADVPGIIFDIQNEPSVNLSNIPPELKREFNRYLTEKYRTTERLHEVWENSHLGEKTRAEARGMGEIDVKAGSDDWHDMRTFDLNYFKVLTLNRWVEKNAEGVRSADPNAILTVGYLPWTRPADKILGTKHIDFSNMHYYGSIANFPREFKLIDRRFEGKSFSLGEYGAQSAHDDRSHGRVRDKAALSIDRFMAIGHYALGLGASFIANWDWKDFNGCVFPWGLNYAHNMVSKPWLKAYRAQNLFFKSLEPKYIEPEVYYVVPDNHRLGAKYGELNNAILYGLDLLLGCHVNFGVINEYDIDRLPKDAKALIWPIPYCPKDDTFDWILQFVHEGGKLYLSGDVAWDEFRKRTRTERLDQLNLPDLNSHAPFQTPEESFSQPPITTEVARGRVFFVPYPLELYHDKGKPKELYRKFLDFAGVKRIAIEPDNPAVHLFSLPMQNGDTAYIFYNGDTSTEIQKIKLLDTRKPIELTLRRNRPGLVLVGEDGKIKALEAEGDVSINGKIIIKSDSHFMLSLLDSEILHGVQDDIAQKLLFLPLESGKIEFWDRENKDFIAEVGEFVDGEWQCFEKIDVEQTENGFVLSIDKNRALNVIFLSSRIRREK